MTRRGWWLLALAVASLALAASGNSITNSFAYDDVMLIETPQRLHTMAGWWREFARTYWPENVGGDGYRPLTIIAYRIEWALGGGSPVAFHAVNITLHVITSVAVFWMACAILPLAAAWIAAALYAVHPVHVEAIANVVGQSELAVAFLVVLAVATYLHGRRAGPITRLRWIGIGALYAVACLFKEHAIVMPALLLLAEATVVHDPAPLRQRLVAIRPALLILAVVGLGYFWARSRVVPAGFSGFQPFAVFQGLDLSNTDRILTMIGNAPEWLRLFLWPARLMTEYTPPYVEVAQGPSIAQLPGLLVLLGTLGLAIACWRRAPAVTFGIGWIVVTLLPASNFVVPAGFIIAERTLLLPSVGAVVALAAVVPALYARFEGNTAFLRFAPAAVALLLALGIARSVTRNVVWHDTETLFRQGIKDSPESYRAHFMLGGTLFRKRELVEAEVHVRHALKLFPYDAYMAFTLAEEYRRMRMCQPAIPLYRWAFGLHGEPTRHHMGFAWCLLATRQPDEAREMALVALRAGAHVRTGRAIIARAMAMRDTLARGNGSR